MAGVLAACAAPTEPTPVVDFPDPADLPWREEPPDPRVAWADGSPIHNATDWRDKRRPELLALFRHYVYGFAPDPPTIATAERALADDLTELDIALDRGPTLHTLLFLPSGPGPFPVLLGLNKCGNHTVSARPEPPDHGAFLGDGCSGVRGSNADAWTIDAALSAGVAVATVHQSDIAPDDPESPRAGVLAAYDAPGPAEGGWGTIAAWAFGLTAVTTALAEHPAIDPARIAAFGHSRRGKAALWAAAQDERIALALPHQSGIAGAALARDSTGETVRAINALFPHWFNDRFTEFADAEERLPIDQHLLIALVAPRPVHVSDGADDFWANPQGARLAVELAAPVCEDLLDAPPPRWTLRDGDHAVVPDDWARWRDEVLALTSD